MKHSRDLLTELAGNLRWIWNGEFDSLFREIDPVLWTSVNHNPTAFLLELDAARLEARAADPHYRVRLERACHSLKAHLESEKTWANVSAPALAARPVAYFSAEFGLHESLPIYSGGLGVLAGDHLKSSSDLGVPIWGVTILYREGYFFQNLTTDGTQEEVYTEMDLRRVALERVMDSQGQPMSLLIPVNSGNLVVEVWKTRVGRAHLLLLDGYSKEGTADRFAFTRRLYGGDLRTRLHQEIILGMGGYRALRKLGIRPGVIHLNEGHSAFAVLEAISQVMEEEDLSFEAASERVRSRSVFTTHTPVAAGHDRFPPELVNEHLAPLRSKLKLSPEAFVGLGRIHPNDEREPFCMTVVALKLASKSNAVSALHGQTTRSMWKDLWSKAPPEVPIGHVTNGVHVPSWIAPQLARFFERLLGPEWFAQLRYPAGWEAIDAIDPFEIWDLKCALKKEFAAFVDRRIQRRDERLGLPHSRFSLNPEAMVIGYARRIVEYKRPTLLFRDADRLARLMSDPKRPVQIVFAGKAHPNDQTGKAMLKELYGFTQDPRFAGKAFVLENYDMNMGRHFVQGCDLWLNSPRRPFEACGTSGQKAIFNATLNLSSLDGWWAEAYDKKNGYSFGDGLTHSDVHTHDRRDAEDLIRVLENKVIPDFFERTPEGVPSRWIDKIKHALVTLGSRYNSDRMVLDYAKRCYVPTVGALTSDFPTDR
ncbi:MAG TPA: alpha-glucan family phosphorylase [Bdellovibrionota bacterium]|nr:alpha-glucan family phosphorylase [Bdellovibrionota bacterium]